MSAWITDAYESVELRLAVHKYHGAVELLYRTPPFAYGEADRAIQEVNKAKAEMDRLATRDYYLMNPHGFGIGEQINAPKKAKR